MFNAGPFLPGLRELVMLIWRVTVSWGAIVDSGWLAAWGTSGCKFLKTTCNNLMSGKWNPRRVKIKDSIWVWFDHANYWSWGQNIFWELRAEDQWCIPRYSCNFWHIKTWQTDAFTLWKRPCLKNWMVDGKMQRLHVWRCDDEDLSIDGDDVFDGFRTKVPGRISFKPIQTVSGTMSMFVAWRQQISGTFAFLCWIRGTLFASQVPCPTAPFAVGL